MSQYTGVFTKQPNETFPVDVSFANRLASGESVASKAVSARVADTGADATADVITSSSLDSPTVTVIVKGGTDGVNYIITVRATTDAAVPAVHEADLYMAVAEV